MQGSEATAMVILNMVIANKRVDATLSCKVGSLALMTIRNTSSKVHRLQRAGRYGFVAKKGCLNVSVSRAKLFHVSSLVIQRLASQRSRTPLLQTPR